MKRLLPADEVAPSLVSVAAQLADLPMFAPSAARPARDGAVVQMARASDPMTSKNAAAGVLGSVIWQRAEIVRALQYAWARGFTAPEVSDFLNREALNPDWQWTQEMVSRRIPEVRVEGNCVTCDAKARPGVRTMSSATRELCAIHVYARGGIEVGEPPELQAQRQRAMAVRMTA